MARREKLAAHDADRAYHEFVDTERSLKSILKDDLRIEKWQEVYLAVAGMRELRTPAQRALDKDYYARGEFGRAPLDCGVEFREARRAFWEQRKFALHVTVDELTKQDFSDSTNPFAVIDRLAARCESIFYFEPHRAACLELLGLTSNATRAESDIAIWGSKKRYFIKVVGDALFKRDMESAFHHLTASLATGITADGLRSEFQKLGLQSLTLEQAEMMIKNADGAREFESVLNLMIENTTT